MAGLWPALLGYNMHKFNKLNKKIMYIDNTYDSNLEYLQEYLYKNKVYLHDSMIVVDILQC